MLFKLAFRNVKRQVGSYLIYFVTVALTVALMFAVNNFIYSDLMIMVEEVLADFIDMLLIGISWGIGIVSAFVLGYVTSYLLRRRKKEFGLYLTLGMSRKNIVMIFAGETAVNFLLSLGVGILIGLGLFPALIFVAFNFLGMEPIAVGYSLEGSLLTVAIIAAVFLLSSLFSMFYLGKAKISSLLNGEKKVERSVKYPVVWFALALASIAVMCIAGTRIYELLVVTSDVYLHLIELLMFILLSVIAIVLFLFGLAKGVVPTLLKWKWFASRGVNTFTLRQLSGRLNTNAMTLSILSILLSVAVVATNFMVNTRTTEEATVFHWYPYDVFGSVELKYQDTQLGEGRIVTIEEGIERVKKYAKIEKQAEYYMYSPTLEYGQYDVYYLRESDYRAICEVRGITPKECGDGFIFLYRDEPDIHNPLDTDIPVVLNGVSYSCVAKEQIRLVNDFQIVTPYVYVVTDEAVVDLEKVYHNVAIALESNHYDAEAMSREFKYEEGGSTYSMNFSFQECERRDILKGALIYLLITIFISVVFVMLSMAVIALKVLTIISEDKERYRAVWRLGAGESALKGSLFEQIFFFFFLPFGVPLVLSVPVGLLFIEGAKATTVKLAVGQIVGQVAGIAGVLLLIYLVYFLITYLVAWREVKKSVRSSRY